MLEASADDIVAWGDREFCPNQTSLRVATDYVRKLGLIRNVAISNKVYGRPLPSIHLLRKYNEGNSMSETQGALLVPRPFLSDGDSAPRQWASRWRKKYNVKSGKIRFGEPLSETNKRLKVNLRENLGDGFSKPGVSSMRKSLGTSSGTDP